VSEPAPYRGLAPFEDSAEDARRFFGREGDRDVIIANLLAHPLTVLHAESGVGKSSLLRAGVAQRLRAGGDGDRPLAVVVFDAWHSDPLGGLAAAVDAAVAAALGDGAGPVPPGAPLAERVEMAAIRLDGELYVLLDQVEELLLYHGRDAATLRELGRTLSRASGASFLLAIRDDALGQLDALRAAVPGILGNTLRLQRLTRADAEEAIRRPLDVVNAASSDEAPITIEPGLVAAVLDEVAAGRVELGPARGSAEGGGGEPGVEAPYLQLVLARVWDEEQRAGSRVLRLSTLEELGGARAIVEGHLREALDGLTPEQQDTAASVFNHLVTPSGAKVAHAPADLARYARVDPSELDTTLELLSSERVLRPVATPEGRRYEIFHDVLAGGILSWTGEHERERTVERERQEGRRRQRRLLALVAILAALCAVAAFEWRRADQASTSDRAHALAATARADLATDPQHSLALALQAVALRQDGSTVPVLRDALLESHERVVFRLGSPIRTASLSPDGGRVLLAAPPLAARVADARDGRVTLALRAAGPARTASWSPDGGRIVTAGVDGRARVSDAATGRLLLTLPQIAGLRTAVFSPDGRRILTTSDDGGLRLYDAGNGTLLRSVTLPAAVRQAVFDRTGRLLATRDSNGAVRVLRVPTLLTAYRVPKDPANSVAFSADGSRLAFGGLHLAHVLDAATGRLVLTEHVGSKARGGQVLAVALSPDGSQLAIGGSDDAARIYDVASKSLATLLVGHALAVTGAAFSPRGHWLVTTSPDTTARVWRVTDGEQRATLAGSTDRVTAAEFSKDGGRVLTTSADGTARLWDDATVAPLRTIARFTGPLRGAAPLAGGRVVLLAGPGPRASLLDTITLRRSHLQERGPVIAVAAGDGLLATATAAHVTVWNSSGRPLWSRTPASAVNAVALDRSGRLAVALQDGTVALYDRTGRPLHPLTGPTSPALSVSFSPDGRLLAVGLASETAWIWDVDLDRNQAVLRGHSDAVLGTAFSPDGQTVATASRDHDVRLWSPDGGPSLTTFRGHGALVNAVAFSPDGRWVATAGPRSSDIFPIDSGLVVGPLLGPTSQLKGVWFTAGGSRLLAAGLDGRVREYDCSVCGSTAGIVAAAHARLAHVS
jgi:WD40 repeat protein